MKNLYLLTIVVGSLAFSQHCHSQEIAVKKAISADQVQALEETEGNRSELPNPANYTPMQIPTFKPPKAGPVTANEIITYDLRTGQTTTRPNNLRLSGNVAGNSLEGAPARMTELINELQNTGITNSFSDFETVFSPSANPWRRNAKLFFSNPNGNFVCSGALINPRYIITAGHCVFDHDNNVGFASSMEVVPAFDNGDAPFGMANAVRFTTFTGWTSSEDFDFDIAIVELDRPIGAIAGWFGYGWNSSDSFYSGTTFNNPGYPAASPFNGQSMFTRFGNYDSVFSNRFEFSPPCFGGHSGSGSYYIDSNGSRFVHAAHSYTTFDGLRSGHVRITESKFNVFQDQITSTTPTSPDLYVMDFSAPNTATAGDDFSNVSYLLHNSSQNQWSGSINVDLYLSTNDIISTGDTLLETVTWNGTLSGNGSVIVNASNITVPASLSSGDYYLGGIITNSDFDTGNNTSTSDDTHSVFIESLPVPENDSWFSSIFILDPDVTVTGTNANATTQTDEQDLGSTGSTVWWFVDADSDGTMTVDTFGSNFDTQLHVYEFAADFADLVLVDNNDDSGSLQSMVSFPVTAGTCYEIRVGGFGSPASASEGNIQLNLAFEDSGTLMGDINCDGAVTLLDVQPFVGLISNGEYLDKADFDFNGVVDLLDIQGFVDAVSGG